jgi:hypothetical protein
LQDINTLQETIIPLARAGMDVTVPIAPSGIPDENILNTHYESDGILFYVGEASYEAGPSLLAAWVPVHSFTSEEEESPLEVFARHIQSIAAGGTTAMS